VAERFGWPNVYTLTKGLAEQLIAQRAPDAVIVRPTIVECARRTPFAGWNEGLNTSGPLAWLITTAFRHLPARDHVPFDVVPVDDVAAGLAVATAAAIDGSAPQVLHLASSDTNPLTLGRTIELTGLAMRRWCRDNGRPVDRLLYQHLDPVSVPADAPGPFAPRALRDWISRARALWPESDRLTRADGELERVERMLRLYRPFIHDHAPVFRTDGIRALSDGNAAPFRFDVSDIDWRRYWIDVEYPGLRTWCFPLVDGRRAPLDPPSVPPLRIAPSAPLARAAK
jgi:long-chain acyl-CoA synthetase